jgi:uncharacterized protein
MQAAADIPASPCIGVCLMDPATRTCRGCLRTIAEIARWYEAGADEKRAILARLAARRTPFSPPPQAGEG